MNAGTLHTAKTNRIVKGTDNRLPSRSVSILRSSHISVLNRGYAVGVASRLATVIYVAMVMPILYDNSYSPNNSNLKYESYRLYG